MLLKHWLHVVEAVTSPTARRRGSRRTSRIGRSVVPAVIHRTEKLERRELLTLAVMDLVLVAYNSESTVPPVFPATVAPTTPDTIALLALADIADGETVFLTDRGWLGSALQTTSSLETSLSWVTSGVSAGDIIRIHLTGTATFTGTSYGTLTGAMGFDSNAGDQLLIYQTSDNNSESTPTFISAFSADRPAALDGGTRDDDPLDGWRDLDQAGLATANGSMLPPGLTAVLTSGDSGTALGLAEYLSEIDNYIYNGPTTLATKATLGHSH